VEGKIKIVKYRPDGGETILGVFDEGDAVGHIAVFRRIPYPASAVALDDSLCLEIYRDHFFGTIQRNTQLMECFIQAMMERNYHLVRRLEELTTSSAEQRLAMVFEKFAEKLGQRRKDENGNMAIFVDVPLSRRDIADLVNVRIETAIRMMSRWNKEGPVQTLPNGFLITDPARLSEIAEGEDDDF
jgi:CRP-like cAMP-binding protein